VEAPDVIPMVTGPCGSQFSFSTYSPCYKQATCLFKHPPKYLKERSLTPPRLYMKKDYIFEYILASPDQHRE
jgi:hypothetical protein